LSLFILIQGKSQKIKKHLKEKIKVNKYWLKLLHHDQHEKTIGKD
jgi:hypothetical protein